MVEFDELIWSGVFCRHLAGVMRHPPLRTQVQADHVSGRRSQGHDHTLLHPRQLTNLRPPTCTRESQHKRRSQERFVSATSVPDSAFGDWRHSHGQRRRSSGSVVSSSMTKATAVPFSQRPQTANAATRGDDFDLRDVTDDLKHRCRSPGSPHSASPRQEEADSDRG